MKYFKLQFLFLFIFLSAVTFRSFSQGNTGFFAGGGIMYYNGDMGDKSDKVLTNSALFNPYFCIGGSQWLAGHIEASLWLAHGKVSGADSLSNEQNNLSRNLSFEAVLDELSLRVEFCSLHRYERSRVNMFVFTGATVYHYNPKAKLDNTWYELQPLGTEGQYIPDGSYHKPYSLTQFAIPVGFGVAVQLSKKFRVKTEFCHNVLFTDYLDDLSTVYPDLESLSATPNGDLAVQLSNRKLNGKYPAANSPRAALNTKMHIPLSELH